MSLLSRIRSWFQLPPGTTLVVDRKGEVKANILLRNGTATDNFSCGIELLNDDKTTVEFVVETLMQNAGMKKSAAMTAMLLCHSNGSALIELESMEEAERIAQAITAHARERGYPFVCRAIDSRNQRPANN